MDPPGPWAGSPLYYLVLIVAMPILLVELAAYVFLLKEHSSSAGPYALCQRASYARATSPSTGGGISLPLRRVFYRENAI